MDKIEKFILDNIEGFQRDNPPESIWVDIKDKLENDDWSNFIQKNFDEFNTDKPKRNLWKLIKDKLDDDGLDLTISENKLEFDEFEPHEGLWEKIEKGLEKNEVAEFKNTFLESEPKMVPLKVVWQIAASFLVIIMAIIGFQFIGDDNLTQKLSQNNNSEINLNEISPDLYEAEIYYTSLIEKSQEQISKYDLEKLGLEEDFSQDINHLDSIYSQMKEDLVESQGSEKVISALVENLRLRIEILNRQLEILKQIERYKQNEKREKDGINI
ncbi:hypothetical protein [Flexithrix dorotheae]|uniref:hypothetical protein n=1 Tax=Flexithrix dorotheae TaxID=70993 RepID=UPI00037609AE|nr:hypothetical protein [Flexithrix dorotheae]